MKSYKELSKKKKIDYAFKAFFVLIFLVSSTLFLMPENSNVVKNKDGGNVVGNQQNNSSVEFKRLNWSNKTEQILRIEGKPDKKLEIELYNVTSETPVKVNYTVRDKHYGEKNVTSVYVEENKTTLDYPRMSSERDSEYIYYVQVTYFRKNNLSLEPGLESYSFH